MKKTPKLKKERKVKQFKRFDLEAGLAATWSEDFYRNKLEQDAIIDWIKTSLKSAGHKLRPKKPFFFDEPNCFKVRLKPNTLLLFIDNTAGPGLEALDPLCDSVAIKPEKGLLVHLENYTELYGHLSGSSRRGFLMFDLQ